MPSDPGFLSGRVIQYIHVSICNWRYIKYLEILNLINSLREISPICSGVLFLYVCLFLFCCCFCLLYILFCDFLSAYLYILSSNHGFYLVHLSKIYLNQVNICIFTLGFKMIKCENFQNKHVSTACFENFLIIWLSNLSKIILETYMRTKFDIYVLVTISG